MRIDDRPQPAGSAGPAPRRTPGSAPSAPAGTPARDSPPQPVARAATPPPQRGLQRTRISSVWTGVLLGAPILLLLLVFLLQNAQRVTISFLGFHGQLPLATGLLLAAVAGGVIVAIPGIARVVQLRRTTRAHATGST